MDHSHQHPLDIKRSFLKLLWLVHVYHSVLYFVVFWIRCWTELLTLWNTLKFFGVTLRGKSPGPKHISRMIGLTYWIATRFITTPRRLLAAVSVGRDASALFPDVVPCQQRGTLNPFSGGAGWKFMKPESIAKICIFLLYSSTRKKQLPPWFLPFW